MGLVDLSANLTDEGTPVVTAHSIEPRGCYCAIRGAMLPAFYSPIVYRCSMEKQKETFELHCKERYGGDNQLGTAPKSKTVTTVLQNLSLLTKKLQRSSQQDSKG